MKFSLAPFFKAVFFLGATFFFVFLSTPELKAATFTSVANGAWTTSTTWSPAGVPTVDDIVIINHAITRPAGTYTSWNATSSITINNGGSLSVAGNLTFVGSGSRIIVNTGGTLNVSGTLTLTNQPVVTMSGGQINTGSLVINNGTQLAYTSGALSLTGSLTINSGASYNYTPALAIPGNINIGNGVTVTATTVGGTITLSNASKLNLTGGTLSPSSITLSGSNTELNINGATVTYANALTIGSGVKLTVTSGSFTLNNALTINGGTYSSSAGATTSANSLNVTNSGSTSFTNGGTFNVNGTVTVGGTITNNGTMNVSGDYTFGGGGSSVTNQYGSLNISGSVSIPSSGKFRTYPGSVTVVDTNVTTSANQNLIVGTSPNPPPYSDFIIKGDLISQGSGDILVDTNGRLAVFGDFYSTGGGGSIFTVNDGGMVYVAGSITFNGGGDHLTNNNNGVPYGFYSPNDPVYNGGGGSSNGAAGSNSVQDIGTMLDEAPDFFDWVASIPGSPLPVVLIHFYLEKKDDGIVLHWATASELNFDRFVIEKTRDGKNFVEIGSRQGAGLSTSRIDYSFEDVKVLGRTYYRLKAIDFDGYTEYFGVVTVAYEGEEQIRVVPNPALGADVKFRLNYTSEETLYYRILDASGAQVYSSSIQPDGFIQDYKIEKELSAGYYFLEVKSGQDRKVVRFTVF